MIRANDLVSLSELFGINEPAGRPDHEPVADPPGRRAESPVRRSAWRAGWSALLIGSAARGMLALLAGLLLASLVPALAGWHPSVVMTGSMQPSLRPGDVVIARPAQPRQLRPGQVLLVTDPDQPGRLRLHRLVRFTDDGSLILRGDANPAEDSSPVPPAGMHGVAVLRVPGVGLPMLWARQDRYLPLGMAAMLLGTLLGLAGAYRPAESQPPRPKPPAQARSPQAQPANGGRSVRRRLSPAVCLLTGLAVLQLAHPTPAEALFAITAGNAGDNWAAAQYYSCRQAVLASSPVLYYQLDETNGRTVTDSSSAGATGTYTQNGVTRGQPGTCNFDGGTAVTLNGTSGYLYRNSQSTAPSTFSWELWFATSTVKGGWLIGMGSSQTGQSSTTDRQLYLTNSGQVGFGISSGGTKRTVLSPASYNDGGWHLADATFSAGTGMRLYLDGQLVASNSAVTSAQSYSGYLRVGYDNLTGWSSAPTSFFLAGSIDEVSAYATVLTATQIGYHYGAGS